MTEFRVGDRVRCVDTTLSAGRMTFGQEYIVTRVPTDREQIYVKGDAWEWNASRFELVHRPSSLDWDPDHHLSPSDIGLIAGGRPYMSMAAWMHFCFLAPRIVWRLEPIKSPTVLVELPRDRVERLVALKTGVSTDWFVGPCAAALAAEGNRP